MGKSILGTETKAVKMHEKLSIISFLFENANIVAIYSILMHNSNILHVKME